jgi:hypothetical protein
MYVYQQAFYFLIGLGILFGLPAYWLFARGMWPAKVDRAREAASRSFILNAVLGAPVVTVVIVTLTRVGKFGPVAGSVAAAVAIVALFWALIGVAGLALHVGTRLWPGCTGNDAWRGMLRGSMVVAGSLTIPFIGWFLLPILLIAVGAGIRVRMWFPHAAPQPQTQPHLAPQVAPQAISPAAPSMPQPTP